MSSKKKKIKEKDERKELYNQAADAFRQGLFPSVTACAGHFGVNHKTLIKCLESEREYVGSGRKSSTFTTEEESKLVKFVSDRLSLGCGIDISQLCSVIQELANSLKASNPDREFPSSWVCNYPHESFVRRFIKRNNLVMRRTMSLSNARAMLTVSDLDNWFKDVEGRFVSNPKFGECFTDPRRIYNQDETPLSWGVEHQPVLAVKGYAGPTYNLGGSSRQHTTASVMVGADGSVPSIRIVWSGKIWGPAEKKLRAEIPADGVTGKWKFSKTLSGYVTREIFLEILSDLTDHITENNIPRPVILVIDGFRGHLGLAISEYCDQNGIQLML